TGRSTESRRTDPAPQTSQRGTPSAETRDRTESSALLPGFAELHPDTPASSISGDYGAHEPVTGDAETSWSNYHTCTCSWTDDTGSTAHFATFPERLAERCILAGSSPQACAMCGAPWERVVE